MKRPSPVLTTVFFCTAGLCAVGPAVRAAETPPAAAQAAAVDPTHAQLAQAAKFALEDPEGIGEDRDDLVCEIAAEQAASGDPAGALRTIAKVANRPKRVEALCAVARAQHAKGNTPGALQTLVKARDAGFKLVGASEIREVVGVIVSVGRAQAALGDLAAAYATAAKFGDSGEKNEVLQAIAEEQVARGHLSEARKTIAMNHYDWSRFDMHMAVASAAAKAGQKDAALQIIADARRAQPGLSPGRVAAALLAAGELKGAAKSAAVVAGDYAQWEVVCQVAEAQHAAGDAAGARALLASMAFNITGLSPDEEFGYFFRRAEAQARVGDGTGLKATAATLAKKAAALYESSRPGAFARIGSVQSLGGDAAGSAASFATALRVALRLEAEEKDSALEDIAEEYRKRQDYDAARQTLAKVEDTPAREVLLARVCATAGDAPGALKRIQAVQDQAARDHGYGLVAEVQIAGGDLSGAKANVDRMRDGTIDKARLLLVHARALRPAAEKVVSSAK